jgi:hypothetical protein
VRFICKYACSKKAKKDGNKRDLYYNKKCKYAKNHVEIANHNHHTIAMQLANGITKEKAKKVVNLSQK